MDNINMSMELDSMIFEQQNPQLEFSTKEHFNESKTQRCCRLAGMISMAKKKTGGLYINSKDWYSNPIGTMVSFLVYLYLVVGFLIAFYKLGQIESMIISIVPNLDEFFNQEASFAMKTVSGAEYTREFEIPELYNQTGIVGQHIGLFNFGVVIVPDCEINNGNVLYYNFYSSEGDILF